MVLLDIKTNKVSSIVKFALILTGYSNDSISYFSHEKQCVVTRKLELDMDDERIVEELYINSDDALEEVGPKTDMQLNPNRIKWIDFKGPSS